MQVKIRVDARSEAGEPTKYQGDIALSVLDDNSLSQTFTFELINPDDLEQQLIIIRNREPIIHVHGPLSNPTKQTKGDLLNLPEEMLLFLQLVGPSMAHAISAIWTERQVAGPAVEVAIKKGWAKILGQIRLVAHGEHMHELRDPVDQSNIITLCQCE